VASVHIARRKLASGGVRYRVRWRAGGRESPIRYGGSFKTKRQAEARARWLRNELAAARLPDLRLLADREPRTMAAAAAAWQASRIDVASNTRAAHRRGLAHVLAAFGEREPATITPGEVASWVGTLARRLKPGYVRKIVDVLAMIVDHEGITPEPGSRPPRSAAAQRPRRDRAALGRGRRGGAARLRAALSATCARLGIDGNARRRAGGPAWGDLDPANARWRVARQREKGKRGRWVPVPTDVFTAVDALLPREDRDLEAPVFGWLSQSALRTDIYRACKAVAVPLWSPHDLRHRRISLWHRAGVSWAQIGEWAGQRDLATTANRYTHVVLGREIDRAGVVPPVVPSRPESGRFAG
jgi:integrase